MGKTLWTKNQEKAIYTPASVLVNAAAGSGKTAVLVERIIRKLTEDNTDIDRLLIVTFARDAAAQMQQRIKKTLMKRIQETGDTGLKRQLRLLAHSDITTIDAFCINTVKKNFHVIGIDPNFKIMDEDEAKITLDIELDNFLNSMYEAGDERIEALSEHYSEGFGDYKLKSMIKELFNFTRSLPDPKRWITESAEQYRSIKNSKWYDYIMNRVQELADSACCCCERAAELMTFFCLGEKKEIDCLTAEEIQSLEEYDNNGLWESIEDDYENCQALKSTDWDTIADATQHFSKFSAQTLSGDFKTERKEIIAVKNETAETAGKISKLMGMSLADTEEMYSEGIYPVIKIFAEVVCEFSEYYFNVKQKKNSFEFNDLEHMCLQLFLNSEAVLAEYQNKYDEILMDEYQDTNSLQERIFDLLSDKRFMVGDMKQSIYRFRNSDPFIFKNKDRLYCEKPDKGSRIVLSENFRSRPQVLNSINQIFSRIMSEDAGEVDYDESQSLKWGNKEYGEPEDSKYFSELCILEGRDDDSDDTNVRVEARFIARKIKSMIEEGFLVVDSGENRNAQPKDFVILLSSVRRVGAVYREELSEVGIDSYSESTGYLDRIEVRLMLSLIQIINNPLQDIPLVAVMRSPLFGFSEDELARIRMVGKGLFYEAVLKMAEGSAELSEKCKGLCGKIDRWREYAKYMSSDRLIWTLYEETSFYDLMGVLYDGEETQANLRLLFEKAKQYEKTGFKGLFHFLEFMKRMEQSSEMGGAKTTAGNVVRIMTIHKSKGLEFPVCFLAGTGSRFMIGRSGVLRLHKDWGIGIDYVSPENGFFTHTPTCEVIKSVQRKEEQSENMRKLYVGMTRAREKLIVTGIIVGKKYNSDGSTKSGGMITEREKWNKIYSPDKNYISPEAVNEATRYIDWIAPIVLAHGADIGWLSRCIEYNRDMVDSENSEKEMLDGSDISESRIDELMSVGSDTSAGGELPGKISVTGINRLRRSVLTDEDITDFEIERNHNDIEMYISSIKRPSFMQEKNITGAERGIAYHTLMSKICISDEIDCGYVKGEIQRLLDGHELTAAADSIDPEKICRFFLSELGKRMRSSDMILREEAFELYISASEVLGSNRYENDKILLQGVIDCLFSENGELVILDYKTDRGLTEEELKERYSEQLIWYKKAAERMTGMKVSSGYLYSLEQDKEIRIF